MRKNPLQSLALPRATQMKLGALLLALAFPSVARAANFTWGVGSGTWSTGSSWVGGVAPTSNVDNTVIELTNGTSGTPAEATLTADWILRLNSSVTINANNTLTLSGGATFFSSGATPIVTNHGIIQSSSTSGKLRGGSGTRINDGMIQALSSGTLTLWDVGQVTNTGGTIQAKSGGTVKFEGSSTITNGTLKSESGGNLFQDGLNPNQQMSLNGVTVTNQGTFTSDQSTAVAAAGGASLRTTLGAGTVFTNEVGGVTQVRNTGGGTTSSATVRQSLFTVGAGSTFANAGTLLVQNDATRFGSLAGQDATFTVASGATFSNTGTVQVIANTTAIGATAAFTSGTSITNQGVVRVKGNANGQFASFSVTGAGNDYTQSGGGTQRTILEQGGSLSAADAILINAGTLGGVGSVTGATTIGSDATLAAGETYAGAAGAGVLAFNNNLSLSNDSEIKFALGLDTSASSQVTLAGASGLTLGTNITVTLTDLTGGNWVSGTTYRLFDLASGTITGDIANFSLVAPVGWTGTFSTGAGGTDYIDFTLNVVPEPSAIMLLVGSMTVMMIFARRRRFSQ